VDLNVPMQDGAVSDDTRLRATLPTVTELADKGAIVLLLAHFGRPKGDNRPDMSLSLVTRPYEQVLGRPVRFVGACAGELAAQNIAMLRAGDIAILENTRFHIGEERNDPELARAMARLATSTSTMPSPRLIAPTPPRKGSPTRSRLMPGARWKRS
jgi:phosphoglycerate kinase